MKLLNSFLLAQLVRLCRFLIWTFVSVLLDPHCRELTFRVRLGLDNGIDHQSILEGELGIGVGGWIHISGVAVGLMLGSNAGG